MKSRDFCYWLQGFFEIHKETGIEITLTNRQVAVIEHHLNMVFLHEIDPSFPAHQQGGLQSAHDESKTDNAPSSFNLSGKMRC